MPRMVRDRGARCARATRALQANQQIALKTNAISKPPFSARSGARRNDAARRVWRPNPKTDQAVSSVVPLSSGYRSVSTLPVHGPRFFLILLNLDRAHAAECQPKTAKRTGSLRKPAEMRILVVTRSHRTGSERSNRETAKYDCIVQYGCASRKCEPIVSDLLMNCAVGGIRGTGTAVSQMMVPGCAVLVVCRERN